MLGKIHYYLFGQLTKILNFYLIFCLAKVLNFFRNKTSKINLFTKIKIVFELSWQLSVCKENVQMSKISRKEKKVFFLKTSFLIVQHRIYLLVTNSEQGMKKYTLFELAQSE